MLVCKNHNRQAVCSAKISGHYVNFVNFVKVCWCHDNSTWEAAEHAQAPEPCELLDARKLEVVQVDQTEGGPE